MAGHMSDRYSRSVRLQAAAVSLIEKSRTRWTRARLGRFVQLGAFEGEPIELIEGELVDRAPQGVPHAGVIELLNELLIVPLVKRARVRVQLPFAIGDDTELLPDLAIVPRNETRDDHPSHAELIIEVAESSERYDRLVKAPLYARARATEYWLIDVARETVTVFSKPRRDGYAKEQRITSGELAVPGFPDVKIVVEDLF